MIIKKTTEFTKATYILTGLVSAFSIAVFLLASTPPFSRDALIHHLYVPKLWIQKGNIGPIDSIVFSFYPMNLDLLYMIPLSFGNDIIPKYIHFSFAILTALLIFIYLQNRLNKSWALFGSLFFLSLPIIVKLSITVYVDLGVVFFSTASLLSLLKWGESYRLRYLLLAGICCGLAAGTKYNALISIFLLTLLTPLIYIRLGNPDNRRHSIKSVSYAVLFFLITIAVYSPWLIRNYQVTGNPIYPLHQSIFKQFQKSDTTDSGSTSVNVGKIGDAGKKILTRRSSTLAQRKQQYGETWPQVLLLPVRFFFEGQDDDPQYFDGKLNPYLLIFMLFAFYHHRYSDQIRKEQLFLLSFGWLFFFFTFFQEALRIRYIATSIPCFVILATFGLHNIHAKLYKIERLPEKTACIVIALLGSAAIYYNGHYLIDHFIRYKPIAFLTKEITRDDYISRILPEYPVQLYANNNLPADSKIMAIYVGRRGYYFEHPVIFDPIAGKSKLGGIIRKSTSPEDINLQLQEKGLTHLFIRFDLFNKMANANLTLAQIKLFNDFLTTNTKQLASNSGYGQSYVLFALDL